MESDFACKFKAQLRFRSVLLLAMTVSCLCTSNGEAFPGHDMLLKIGCKLGECRVVLCESGAKHRLQNLQLNFPSDDVAFALKDSKELPSLAKYL
ncbi:hypothetical protein CerSpe_162050 [Prunus speciosa]